MHSEDRSDWVNIHADLTLPWAPSQFVGFVMASSHGKTVRNQGPITFEPNGALAKLLQRPLCVREIVGSIVGRVIQKTL